MADPANALPVVQDVLPVKPKARAVSVAVIAALAFLVSGPSIIIVNKYIMVDLDYNYPVMLSILGTSATWLLAVILIKSGVSELRHRDVVTPRFYLTSIAPVGCLTAVALGGGNSAYLYLTVSFIQMLKALTPALTMCLLYLAGLVHPSQPAVVSVLVMTISTVCAAQGEVNFNLVGVIVMMSSVGSEAFKMLLSQKLFTGKVSFSVAESQYYLAPPTVVSLLALASFDELPKFMAKQEYLRMWQYPWPFILSTLLALAVIYSSFFVIKTTNSLMLKLLAAARNAMLVLFCTTVLQEQVTLFQAMCYFVTLLAFAFYNYAK